MPDTYDLQNTTDDDEAAQKARALAQLLRGQGLAGNILSLTGDRAVAPLGASWSQQAQQGQQSLNQVPQQRASLAQHRATTAGTEAETEAAANLRELQSSPEGTALLRLMGKKALPEGGDVIDKAPGALLMSMLKPLQQSAAADTAAGSREQVAQIRADAMRAGAQERQDRATAGQEQRNSDKLDKRFIEFGKALDVSRGRQGEAGKVAGNLNQIERDLALIAGNPNPNAQSMYELARGFDRVVSGAAPTQGATEHLMPKSWRGSLGDFEQWLTSQPQGRGQQAFVKQMADSLQRIKKVNQDFLSKTLGQSVTANADLHGKDPARFEAALHAAEIDPAQFDPKTWVRKAPEMQPSAGTSAAVRRTVNGETREWNGTAWVPVAQGGP